MNERENHFLPISWQSRCVWQLLVLMELYSSTSLEARPRMSGKQARSRECLGHGGGGVGSLGLGLTVRAWAPMLTAASRIHPKHTSSGSVVC